MFNKPYEQRLAEWRNFREQLEHCDDPVAATLQFYDSAPLVSIQTDPYTPSTWPSPWELLEENVYCEYCKLLAMCYTLQLTERFSKSKFEIHIGIDRLESSTHYLLYIDDIVIGYHENKHIHRNEVSDSVEIQYVHDMPNLY